MAPREHTPSYNEEEEPESDDPVIVEPTLPEVSARYTELERRVRKIERAAEKAASAEVTDLRKTLAMMKDRAEERAAAERAAANAAALAKAAEEKATADKAAADKAAADKAEADKAFAIKQAAVARRAEYVKIGMSILLTGLATHVATRQWDCRPMTSKSVPAPSATISR